MDGVVVGNMMRWAEALAELGAKETDRYYRGKAEGVIETLDAMAGGRGWAAHLFERFGDGTLIGQGGKA